MWNQILSWRVTVYGLLSWAIPFAASIAFFDASGKLMIALPLFKSLMVLVGMASGILLLLFASRQVLFNHVSAPLVGLFWLIINLALDILILVPMSHTAIPDYFADIGLRYLTLPMIAWAMGILAERVRSGIQP